MPDTLRLAVLDEELRKRPLLKDAEVPLVTLLDEDMEGNWLYLHGDRAEFHIEQMTVGTGRAVLGRIEAELARLEAMKQALIELKRRVKL